MSRKFDIGYIYILGLNIPAYFWQAVIKISPLFEQHLAPITVADPDF